ncbi:MAG: hypothetical protein SGARI_000655 [Bacillariaceae sp.]
MADDSSNKRKRKVEDDLVCPITLELPVDPVTAADGRIYERAAIERHLETSDKSPYTNETLKNTDLLDAPQTRNTIETLVESGVIGGDLAATWKERTATKEELLRKAEDGDAAAMGRLAHFFCRGQNDFQQDCAKAYEWAKKAHAAGSVLGTFHLGRFLVEGLDGVVETKCNQGATYLALAAARGSTAAAYYLGYALGYGDYGLEIDRAEAIRLLEQATTGTGQKGKGRLAEEGKKLARLCLIDWKEESA